MATKEELKELIGKNLPDNVTYEIEPAHLREVLAGITESMAMEGMSGPTLDLGVEYTYWGSPNFLENDEWVIDPYVVMKERAAGELKNGHRFAVEIFQNRIVSSRYLHIVDRTGGVDEIVFAGAAESTGLVPNNEFESRVYAFTYVEEEGKKRILVNLATYKYQNQ